MLDPYIPGTTVKFTDDDDSFFMFKQMINVTNGLLLGQVCRITNLQTSTIQNWVKRGYVPKPESKRYYDRHLARILLISSLRDCMKIEDIGELMTLINGDVDDTSDDIVSEQDLYNYFCLTIKRLEIGSLTEKVISKTIDGVIENYSGSERNKLIHAIKVMVYSYISSLCQKQVDMNIDQLKQL